MTARKADPRAPAARAVLIVEDSATQAERLRALFSENEYDVTVASNGAEALAAARHRAFAVVISDVMMPEMNGYALCKAIKSDEKLRETPVVLLTSLTSSLDVIKGLECGADNFIRKPYDEDYLLSRLRYLLANRDLRSREKTRIGVEIELGGQRHLITSERQQILDLLISTYEQAVQVNGELQEREKDLTRSHHVLNAMYRIAEGLNQTTSERGVAEIALERALDLPGVRAGWISLREGRAGFRILAARGLPPALATPGALEGDCLCRRMLLSGVLDHVSNIRECDRLQKAVGDAGGLRYHATVPLWTPGHAVGLMNLAGPDQGLFGDDDLKVLYGVGNQVGVALERAQLLEGLEAKIAERTRSLEAEIAERKRAEAAARRAEEKYRGIFENAEVGIFQTTLEGRYVTANPRQARILGYESPEDLVASVADLKRQVYVEPGRRDEFIRLVTERGAVEAFESRVYRKDGSVIWISEAARAVRDSQGALVGFEGTTVDITARKAAEAARERLVAILEATTDLVGIADMQGRVVYLNAGGRRLLGIGADEDISNMAITDSHPEPGRALVRSEAIPTAIREGVWKGETTFVDRAGRELPVSQVILAHKGPDGQVALLSTVARDLTEHKSLEAQLRQAQKMEAIGQLAGGVAHDFNNILGVISGYADIVLRKLPEEEPLRRRVQEIARAAERATGLTRQLLAFSRKQVLNPRPLDLSVVVAGMEGMLRRLIGEDVDLAMHLANDLPPTLADAGQVEQVILNLAVNARDAMPEGGRLTIETADSYLAEAYARTHVEVQPGAYTMLAVTDTGRGMDEATRSRIFEPFFTTKEVGKGTGLGLSTVYGIVKQSGGHVSVYSEPGQGTTFKVYLLQVGGKSEAAAAQEAAGWAYLPGGSETILVVEDEEALREIIREILNEKGYTVLLASDGIEALEIVEKHAGAIGLVLTDVVMPRLSARELVERLVSRYPDIKRLYMSGYTGHAALRNGGLPKGQGFLDKPFTPDALLRKVREALDTSE